MIACLIYRSRDLTFWPHLSAALVNGPVPRLPDGKPDLTGPWVGGGSNADIERDGGLKPGELPLLPWAKEPLDKGRGDEGLAGEAKRSQATRSLSR